VLAESVAAPQNHADDEARFLRDLEAALAASKADARAAADAHASSDSDAAPSPRAQGPSASTSNGAGAGASNPASEFLRERRILEQQRLVRMNKGQGQPARRHTAQKRNYSASMSEEEESDADGRSLKRNRPAATTTTTTTTTAGAVAEDLGQMFWSGELRQTANRFTERTDGKPTFRVSEIIGDVRLSFLTPRGLGD
jgi:tyrosyl-DNA phosphodiesterase-1